MIARRSRARGRRPPRMPGDKIGPKDFRFEIKMPDVTSANVALGAAMRMANARCGDFVRAGDKVSLDGNDDAVPFDEGRARARRAERNRVSLSYVKETVRGVIREALGTLLNEIHPDPAVRSSLVARLGPVSRRPGWRRPIRDLARTLGAGARACRRPGRRRLEAHVMQDFASDRYIIDGVIFTAGDMVSYEGGLFPARHGRRPVKGRRLAWEN